MREVATRSLGARLARALSPRRVLENLRNPILQKELFVAGRKRSTYVLRCVSLLILLAIVALAYLPMVVENRPGESGLAFMQRVQELAPAMTSVILWFEYVTLLLVGPVILGGSLCDERRSGTLGALLTTPLTAFQIASGKLLAGLSQMVILVLLAMPVLLALRVFGGVPLGVVLGMAAVVLSTTLLASTFSLFYSARAPRGFSAAAAAIMSTLVIHGAVSILLAIANAKALNTGVGGMMAVMALSGPVTLGMSTAELLGEPVDLARSATTLCWYNTIYSLAITAIVFLALVVRLRRVMLTDAGSAVQLLTRRQKRTMSKATSETTSAGASTDPALVAVAAAADEVEHGSREVGDRPVLWRELAQPAFRSRARLVVTMLALAALLIYLNVKMESSQDRHGANMMIMGLGLSIMLLLGSGAASSAIPQEREARTLDVLMTTPLSAREIILGKFWGAMRRQWFLPSVLLLHLLLSGVLGSTVPLVALAHVVVVMFASLAFLSAVGIWMSVKSKKSVGASVRTALIGLGVWLLPFPAAALLQSIASLLGLRREGEWFLSLAAVINPVFLGAGSLKIPSMWDSNGHAYFLPEPMFEGSVGFMEFTSVLGIVVGGYLVLAWLALQRARVLLGRQTNRSR